VTLLTRRWIVYLCIFMLAFNLTACTSKETIPQKDAENPVTVIDCIEREVKVPEKVERIGALYAVSGHMVSMLGYGDRIVTVTEGLKRDILLTRIIPEINQASAPKSSGTTNIEELLKAEPDVLFVDEETLQNKGEAETFEKFNIPYFVVTFNSIEEQMDAVRKVGKVIGAEERAEKYISYYQSIIDKVSDRVSEIPDDERIRIYHSVNEATRTDAPDTLPAEWTEIAGLVNVSVGKKLRFVDNKNYANIEQILLWNPDVILVNEDGIEEKILNDLQWKNIKAVKDHKVFLLPNGISRWGHPNSIETPLAILWSAKTIYPEKFEDIDMMMETKNFYKEFFNYSLSDDEAVQILSGKGMRKPKQ